MRGSISAPFLEERQALPPFVGHVLDLDERAEPQEAPLLPSVEGADARRPRAAAVPAALGAREEEALDEVVDVIQGLVLVAVEVALLLEVVGEVARADDVPVVGEAGVAEGVDVRAEGRAAEDRGGVDLRVEEVLALAELVDELGVEHERVIRVRDARFA
jgi:hypothetical protein